MTTKAKDKDERVRLRGREGKRILISHPVFFSSSIRESQASTLLEPTLIMTRYDAMTFNEHTNDVARSHNRRIQAMSAAVTCGTTGVASGQRGWFSLGKKGEPAVLSTLKSEIFFKSHSLLPVVYSSKGVVEEFGIVQSWVAVVQVPMPRNRKRTIATRDPVRRLRGSQTRVHRHSHESIKERKEGGAIRV